MGFEPCSTMPSESTNLSRMRQRKNLHTPIINKSLGYCSITIELSILFQWRIIHAWVDMPMPEKYRCIDIDERRVISDIEIREAVIKACGLRSISEFQLLTLERRKSVVREVMLSLDVIPLTIITKESPCYEIKHNNLIFWAFWLFNEIKCLYLQSNNSLEY